MLSMMARDRAVPVPLRHRAARRGDGGGPVAARGDVAFASRARRGARPRARLPAAVDGEVRDARRDRRRRACCRWCGSRRSGAGSATSRSCSPCSPSRPGSRSGSTAPTAPQRSVVELLALGAAIACAAAMLVVPGLAGHAAQTSPRALALALDWIHLAAGSVWLGGPRRAARPLGRRAPRAAAARARDRRRRGSRASRSAPCSRSSRPGPRRRSSSCRRSARCGRPATAARSS